jgi:hypothetical protein
MRLRPSDVTGDVDAEPRNEGGDVLRVTGDVEAGEFRNESS